MNHINNFIKKIRKYALGKLELILKRKKYFIFKHRTETYSKTNVCHASKPAEKSKYSSDNFQIYIHIFCFLIPLIGFMVGTTLISRNTSTEKTIGRHFIALSIVSTVIYITLAIIFVCNLLF